jgi:hypothetical protein
MDSFSEMKGFILLWGLKWTILVSFNGGRKFTGTQTNAYDREARFYWPDLTENYISVVYAVFYCSQLVIDE